MVVYTQSETCRVDRDQKVPMSGDESSSSALSVLSAVSGRAQVPSMCFDFGFDPRTSSAESSSGTFNAISHHCYHSLLLVMYRSGSRMIGSRPTQFHRTAGSKWQWARAVWMKRAANKVPIVAHCHRCMR
jgi:hypothetical protein